MSMFISGIPPPRHTTMQSPRVPSDLCSRSPFSRPGLRRLPAVLGDLYPAVRNLPPIGEVSVNSYQSLQLRFEALLDDVMTEAYPRDWDENFITRGLLRRLRDDLGCVRVRGLRHGPVDVAFDAYKLAGPVEQARGDVGVIVRIRNRGINSGVMFCGAGFLEAKKLHPHGKTFSALRKDQHKKIVAKSPRTFLLLYDYEPIPSGGGPHRALPLKQLWHDDAARSHELLLIDGGAAWTRAVVLSPFVALASNLRDRNLYGYSASLSEQFCFRFLRGLDLEPIEPASDLVKFMRAIDGGPRYVLVVEIAAAEGDQLTAGPFHNPSDVGLDPVYECIGLEE